jgi:superfamily I DNA/RNA helicase
LFYVAITRAQETLAISHCLCRLRYGNKIACHPSSFLGELPKHLLEDDEARKKNLVSVAAGKSYFTSIKTIVRDA